MKTGIELIAEERREQIEKHGRTIELDVVLNTNQQLSDAAAMLCYGDEINYPDDWDELLIDLFRVFFNVDKLFPVPEEMVIRTLCNFTIQRKKS
jgi:hypothetical protein